ncbi:molybdopterin-dependent oxidoreductase [Sphaerisporangium rufum]|uniref:molybdopterin-dependent oxidoreductase n=1 Tax=Sphaerisporangium rufum TaxID=1381558 RepID=UPI001EF2AE1B|nr:molybdopterin-dependent oxidoreductase [Sphaerisporangium rufum]
MTDNEVRPRGQAWAAAVIGLVAGAAGLGVAELVAGALAPKASPVTVVAGVAVDSSPAPLKEWAIRTFGTNDKTVLVGGILVVLVLIAAGLGVLGRRRPGLARLGFAAFGAVGVAAAVSRPDSALLDVLPSIAGGAVAAWALVPLLRRAWPAAEPEWSSPRPAEPRPEPPAADGGVSAPSPAGGPSRVAGTGTELGAGAVAGADPAAGPALAAGTVPAGGGGAERPAVMRARPGDLDRRGLLTGAVTGVVVAGAAGLAGRALGGRSVAEAARTTVALPPAARPARALPGGADLRIRGLAPFVTPNRDFYRVDTAIVVPQVDPRAWTLKIHGMVGRPIEITYADLLRRPLVEADVTLTCVSNEVGGSYIGNARWLGARLADLLREANIQPGADMLLSTSDDGWTCGTPVDVTLDGRDALLAVAMNGEVLPVSHGFPVRQVIPGLYGYVSATKWVTDIKVTRFDRDEAYWTPRGWAPRGPIKTQSRIDLPRDRATVPAGRTTVAGVAWAQHRGVDAVEVSVDAGPWRPARLADVPGPDTWRQWVLDDWQATPGRHTIQVRATDAAGRTQPQAEAPPAPDGATGWHTITVQVS